MKQQLDELNAKMAELEARAHDAKDQAQARYKQEMAKLRGESKAALAKLEELRAAGDDSWDRMVVEMDKVRDAFTHSFHYFKSQV
jgi:chromosome segregation ATPase